jgi:hypothetical protein
MFSKVPEVKVSSAWGDLRTDYPFIATPKDLIKELVSGKTKGVFFQYGFAVPFSVIKAESKGDVWVVSAPKLSRSGGEAGGYWYVSKAHPSQAVFD